MCSARHRHPCPVAAWLSLAGCADGHDWGPGPEILHPHHYSMGKDEAAARARMRRSAADIVAQSREAMTRSLALLERLSVKGEAEEKIDRWMGGSLWSE
jgi:hypothetical protein